MRFTESANLVSQWQETVEMIKGETKRLKRVVKSTLMKAERAKVKLFLQSQEVELENMQQDNVDYSPVQLSDRVLRKSA